ncbi:hypothetical protein IKF15_00930, partial [Candidatus Saccharibacteria bacterium]|nr:hypothetical protein [Candidatus Saccharibacteria bacterium]
EIIEKAKQDEAKAAAAAKLQSEKLNPNSSLSKAEQRRHQKAEKAEAKKLAKEAKKQAKENKKLEKTNKTVAVSAATANATTTASATPSAQTDSHPKRSIANKLFGGKKKWIAIAAACLVLVGGVLWVWKTTVNDLCRENGAVAGSEGCGDIEVSSDKNIHDNTKESSDVLSGRVWSMSNPYYGSDLEREVSEIVMIADDMQYRGMPEKDIFAYLQSEIDSSTDGDLRVMIEAYYGRRYGTHIDCEKGIEYLANLKAHVTQEYQIDIIDNYIDYLARRKNDNAEESV